jgi:hypothetical protein
MDNIAYWSKQKGSQIEKFRNFRPDNIEVVTDGQFGY